jgi:hypothetical protein
VKSYLSIVFQCIVASVIPRRSNPMYYLVFSLFFVYVSWSLVLFILSVSLGSQYLYSLSSQFSFFTQTENSKIDIHSLSQISQFLFYFNFYLSVLSLEFIFEFSLHFINFSQLLLSLIFLVFLSFTP